MLHTIQHAQHGQLKTTHCVYIGTVSQHTHIHTHTLILYTGTVSQHTHLYTGTVSQHTNLAHCVSKDGWQLYRQIKTLP